MCVQAENEALKRMVKEAMGNKSKAQDRLASLKEHYSYLFDQVLRAIKTPRSFYVCKLGFGRRADHRGKQRMPEGAWTLSSVALYVNDLLTSAVLPVGCPSAHTPGKA